MASPIDPFVRHQVYVEGYKNGEAETTEATFDEITAVVILLSNKLGIENLGELTKREMLAFVSAVKAKVSEIFNKNADLTVNNISSFLTADIELTGKLLSATSGKTVPYSTINLPWSVVADTPIAGVGVEPNELPSAVLASVIATITAAIKSGYADNQTLQDFTRAFVGTAAMKYKDGLANKLKRQWSTAIQTMIQHTSSMVAFKLQSLVSETYTWCSILDSRTSSICRKRNGQVYNYRDGPRPPAHWNCRSFTIPVTVVDLGELPTFYMWAKTQPASIQDDILGPARGRDLRTGKINAEDLPGFDRTRPLTVNDYAGKVEQILNEVA